jgi:hypothetical protein
MLDFNINSKKKIKIDLLECQVDLLLKSLQMYCYMYQYIYPRSQKSMTKEENLRVSLVTDTYEQILNQYKNTDKSAKNSNQKNIFKKFA